MNISDVFKRLGREGLLTMYAVGTDAIQIKLTIDKKDLVNNIEILAREMHMEVETNTENAYKRLNKRDKHDRVFVEELWDVMQKQLKELEEEK